MELRNEERRCDSGGMLPLAGIMLREGAASSNLRRRLLQAFSEKDVRSSGISST
jgi:hypothetical protein